MLEGSNNPSQEFKNADSEPFIVEQLLRKYSKNSKMSTTLSKKLLENQEPEVEKDEENLAVNLFGEEETQSGRVGAATISSVLDKLGGLWVFVFVYLVTQGFTVINVYANRYIIQWSKDFHSKECWTNFRFLCVILTIRCMIAFFNQLFCMILGTRVSR